MKHGMPPDAYPGPVKVGNPRCYKGSYQATGEFRAPRKGEFYLSGAIIEAWDAPNDLSTEYWIAREVVLERCPECKGTGRIVTGWADPF